MSLIRVFGIGSPFGDDQIGWEIVNSLKKQRLISKISSDVLTLTCCNHPKELLDLMSGAQVIFLIDAIRSSNTSIGRIYRLENEEIMREIRGQLSTHEFGLVQVLQLGEVLNELPERIILYGIKIGNIKGFDISNNLLKAARSKLLKKLKKELLTHVERTCS